MRELDVLLGRYLEQCYPDADVAEKSAFEAVLALSDPELVAYLLKNEPPPTDAVAAVIRNILRDD